MRRSHGNPFARRRPMEGEGAYYYNVVKEIILQFILCTAYLATLSDSAVRCSGDGCTSTAPANATMPVTGTPNSESLEPPNPTFRILIFALIVLLAIFPRLWLGAMAMSAYGANMLSAPWHGALAATWFLFSQALCPRWLQWVVHFLLPGTPPPTSAAGLEFVVISVGTLCLGFDPALAYGTYLFADAFIHPLRRQLQAPCDESELITKERRALIWFGRCYFLVGIITKYVPGVLMVVSIGLAIILGLVLISWLLSFAYLPLIFAAETKSPRRRPDGGLLEYAYTPLKDANTIRVLRISPSLTNALPVRCTLLQVPLGGHLLETPMYVAISHKWPAMNAPGSSPLNVPEGTNDDERGSFLQGVGNRSGGLIINGCEFRVHPDILTKLRDVRSAWRPLCVWIDNICIDQENQDEQGQQVALMSRIYADANHVIACLVGLPNVSYGFFARLRRSLHIRLTPDEKEVHDLDTLLYRLRDSRILQDYSSRDSAESFLSMGEPHHWDALYRFFSNEWFRRVWMLQEITMAKRVSFRYCGSEIDWDVMTYALAALRRSGLREFRGFRLVAGINDGTDLTGAAGIDGAMIYDNLRRWRQQGKLLSLLDTLILCLRFQSTQDVDRIFAMLGIISENDRASLSIQPNYKTDKEIIFQQAAWRLLVSCDLHDQFRLLRFAGVGKSRNLSVPSWVPDWTAGLQEFVLEPRSRTSNFRASSRPPQRATFAFSRPGTIPSAIQLNGILVDEIMSLVDISRTPPVNSCLFPIRDALRMVSDHCTTRYTSVEDAFWRTLLTDCDPRGRPAGSNVVDDYKQTCKRYDALREQRHLGRDDERERVVLHGLLAMARSEDRMFSHLLTRDLVKRLPDRGGDICSLFSESSDASQTQIVDPSAGRQICVTKTGYMGLVPRLTQEGDVVVVFHGARTPHVLRKCLETQLGEGRGVYELVGECYIQGGMDGQMTGSVENFTIS